MSVHQFTRALLAGTFLFGCAGSAFALDGQEFAKTLDAASARSGTTIEYSKVDVNGDTVVLHGAEIHLPDHHHILPVGDMTFSGVKESDGGGYTAEALTIPDVDVKRHKDEVTVKNIKVEGIDIPPIKPQAGTAPMIIYRSASAGPISASGPQGKVMAVDKVTSNIGRMDGDAGYTATTHASGLTLHLDHLHGPKFQAAVAAMGYGTVTGHFDMKGSWQSKDGHVELSKFALALDNVGTLGMTLDLTGYTADFVKSLNQLRATAMAKPGDKGAQQALGLGLLGLMQQLSFGGLSIRFDDDSLTDKLLTYEAKQKGITKKQMADATKAMLPIGLARLKNPQFEQEISDAFGKFLDNPKNIEIKALPDKPVAFPIIMGSAMAAPQSLPNVLNVKVTANQ